MEFPSSVVEIEDVSDEKIAAIKDEEPDKSEKNPLYDDETSNETGETGETEKEETNEESDKGETGETEEKSEASENEDGTTEEEDDLEGSNSPVSPTSPSSARKASRKKLNRRIRLAKPGANGHEKTRRFRFNKDHIPRTRGVRLNITIPVVPLPPQPKGSRYSLVAFTTADMARVD